MALIPSDVGLRMRLDNELLPQPVAPLQEIASDLPRMQAGQVFSAQIRDVLPGNTYLALVAGKTVTLSLPNSVKSGDVLDLVVIEQTPKSIVAQLANQPAATGAGTTAYQHTRLSQTAQMLGSLLTAEGETPSPATLNRGQPLLAQPPKTGAELVPVLSKAVTESGLFYEAHQAQWVAGRLPLRNLLQEPQGLHPAPAQAPAQVPAQLSSQLSSQVTPQVPPSTALSVAGPGLAPTPSLPQGALSNPALPLSALVDNAAGEAMPGVQPGAESHPEQSAPASSNTKVSTSAPQTPVTPEAVLNKVVAESLLLYQSNQSQGAHLQGQHPQQTPIAPPPGSEAASPQTKEMAGPATHNPNAPAPASGNETLASREGAIESGRAQLAQQTGAPSTTTPSIPDDLRALVQQQLDAAGTQRLLWHGEVWPGQTMQWQLEWQDRGGSQADGEPAEPWATTLKLTTPRLGEIEASLQLGVNGVRVALHTPYQHIAAEMRAGAADLENALAAAGVPLRGFSVKLQEEKPD